MERARNNYEKFIELLMERSGCSEETARTAWVMYGKNMELCMKYVQSKK